MIGCRAARLDLAWVAPFAARRWKLFIPIGVALAALAYVVYESARGVPLSSGLGIYRQVSSANYQFVPALRWIVYHLAGQVADRQRQRGVDHGGALLSESLQRQLQNLLSMQYSTAALRLLAIEDVLTGPAHLHRDLLTKMKQLRELPALEVTVRPRPGRGRTSPGSPS